MAVTSASNVQDALFALPPDDSGTGATQNFRFQSEVAASFCISMLTETHLVEVVCEWHEDFVLRYQSPVEYIELVSVKHCDSATWSTIESLCNKGGIAHLFDRWLALAKDCRTRLSTNGKMGGVGTKPTPKLLEMACTDGDFASGPRALLSTHVAWGILKAAQKKDLEMVPVKGLKVPPQKGWDDPDAIPPNFREQVEEFLSGLRLHHNLPPKSAITDVHIRQLVEPAVRTMGYSTTSAPAAYKALVDEIETANRDNDGRRQNLAAYIADPYADTLDSKIRETLGRRSMGRDRVKELVELSYLEKPNDHPLLPTGALPPRAAGGQKLSEKMQDGDIEPHEQDYAASLRDLWLDTWPRVKTGFTQDVQLLYGLELEIMERVRNLRIDLAGAPEPYGAKFQIELHNILRQSRLNEVVGLPLSDFHIIGFAYELSNKCRFPFTRLGAAA